MRALHREEDARLAFDTAVHQFKRRRRAAPRKMRPAIPAAAEAQFRLAESILDRVLRIRIEGSSNKRALEMVNAKAKLVGVAEEAFGRVVNYAHPGWTIASYERLGLAYESLAQGVQSIPVPREVRRRGPDAVAIFDSEKTRKAQGVRDDAAAARKAALDLAKNSKWFSEHVRRARNALARLDFEERTIREYRLRPDHTGPNRTLPTFKQPSP